MQVTILGAGNMARGIATRLLVGNHQVHILDRDAGQSAILVDELRSASEGRVSAGTIGDPLLGSVVVLAVPYVATLGLVKQYGDQLNGLTVIDVTNPIKSSYDGLLTPADSSAAEEIAKAADPGARIVKAFNTTFAGTLLTGQVAGMPLDVFLAGDDAEAKATVASLVESGGMRPIDAGPLSRARFLEAAAFLHISAQFTLGTGFASALKIVC
ncbi:NADPH-dependent F420 reductase [Thermasporomyces composti]|uniref:Reduced coenzyme F420:NADP oxidoreductase n=1 Tax=Thermasporomyces composti TaxID=696763 RepID=A0A3D9VBW1_THECX|nr:NADPH-dependent F420 reductase [Thermasporomyces composti]REF37670.1 reduced coenzyme F420:NADP oxidoreductase [Thermasporomyces composti]